MTKFSMIFPGQGSQYIGMLNSFFHYNIIKHTFDEASNIIGINLQKLIQQGSKNQLNNSQYTQPAILTSSVSIYRLWRIMDGRLPSYMLGHSLGEYSALVCANAIKFSDAVKIVFLRGQLMQKAIKNRPSEMQAIHGLHYKIINKICLKTIPEKIASISIFNSNNQIVISGDKVAVQQVITDCKRAGARSTHHLNIKVPAHCTLMKPICKKLKNVLYDTIINKPMVPIINNVDVKSEVDKNKIVNALIKQMYKPVRWKEIIEYIIKKKIFLLLEIGPNKVLTKLNKKNKNIISLCTNNLTNFLIAFKKIN